MGPKSKPPKKSRQVKSKSEWQQCNHCGVILYFKDEQCHLKECCCAEAKVSGSQTCGSPCETRTSCIHENSKLQHSYVYNRLLHAKVAKPDIKGFDWKCFPILSNIVLMHPSTMRLCKFITNGYVTVTGNGYKTVHVSWPCHSLDPRTVAFRSSKFHPGSQVVIQRCLGLVQEAEEIVLLPSESGNVEEYMHSEEFRNTVSFDIVDEVLCIGSTVTCDYWDSLIKLTVVKVSASEMKLHSDFEGQMQQEIHSDIYNATKPLENSADVSKLCDNSICNLSTDTSFELNESGLPSSSMLFSTPISSTKTGHFHSSFNENFRLFDSSQKDVSMYDTLEERYFMVTTSTVIKMHEENEDLSEDQVSFGDIGGLKEQIHIINASVKKLFHSENAGRKRLKMCEGILLIGPSGTGKSLIGKAIQKECGVPFINVTANEVIVRHYGNEDKEIQRRFDEAIEKAPSVLFLDALDKLCCSKQDTSNNRGKRVLSTLISAFDKLKESLENPVLVIATVQKSSSVHHNLKTYDRFNVEVELKVPNSSERHEILQKLLEHEPHRLTCKDILDISTKANAFTGSDLAVLCATARQLAATKCMKSGIDKKDLEKVMAIDLVDMTSALKKVKPFSMIPEEVKIEKVSWDDICGMYEVKRKLKQAVEWPLKYPEMFSRYNINPTSGVLLHGPPGCCKTMLAKALANECGQNFIPVKGPELYHKWYGESERAVRELFERARAAKPCVIFLDEVDALLVGRESCSDGSDVGRKVVCQFLSEFGGIGACDGIIVVAATNRPDILDEAVLRPGRIGELIEVPLPDADTRDAIFRKKLRELPVSDDIYFGPLIEKTKGFCGAQVVAVCKEAAWILLQDFTESSKITMQILLQAIEVIRKPDATALEDYD